MHLQPFESFPWLWKAPARAALESSQELARKSPNVRNHALTIAGNYILLNRCCASLKRDFSQKLQNRVLAIGGARFLTSIKTRLAVTLATRNAEFVISPLVRTRFLRMPHGSSCEDRNL